MAVRLPGELSEPELNEFASLVLEGGEVQPNGLEQRIKGAYCPRIIQFEAEVFAVGAVKRPDESYKRKIFANAKLLEYVDRYEFEIGWFYVCPQHRGKGISNQILNELIESLGSKSVYATSRLNNIAMRRVLLRSKFVSIGQPYPSDRIHENIQLFIRD